jgi:hypothetical protein
MSTNVIANEALTPQDRTRGVAEGGTIPATPLTIASSLNPVAPYHLLRPRLPLTRPAVALRISMFPTTLPWGRAGRRSLTRYWVVASRI